MNSNPETLNAINSSIEEVKQAFMAQGVGTNPDSQEVLAQMSANRCLDGCLGLVYSLLERGANFEYLFLLHGYQFAGRPIAERFDEHYLAVIQDQQQRWFAASPANFDPIDPDSEIIQANTPADLYREIKEKIGGFWLSPGNPVTGLTGEYKTPRIIGDNGQPKLEITIGEWDPETSGVFQVIHPVNIFTKRNTRG